MATRTITRKIIGKILASVAALAVACSVHATQISIANLDSANEGFNDPTPVAPVGNNPGTTLGEQRLNVFRHAAKIWEAIVDSDVEIVIESQFDPLTCSAGSAILGSAGANTVHRNFPGAPLADTWYSGALANSLAHSDLSTAYADISATFNSDIDNNNACLNNTNWYYGLDGNRPVNSIELLSVVMHEIGHGLGFQTFVNLSSGAKFGTPPRDDAYMRNLEDHSRGQTWDQLSNAQRLASSIDTGDLHWLGSGVTSQIGGYSAGVNQGHIRMYAPDPPRSGSSVSHFSNALVPNELMEPFDTGPKPGPGLARQLMEDIGWVTFAAARPVISTLADTSVPEGATAQIGFVIADSDTPLADLALSAVSSNPALVDAAAMSFGGSGKVRTLNVVTASGSTGAARIEISVSDGSSTAVESFDLQVLFNNPPAVSITSPADHASYFPSDAINFLAAATDTEDGNVVAGVEWSSSIDGDLGTGGSVVSSLSVGTHSISAVVSDSVGKGASDAITVTVIAVGDSDGDGLEDAWELGFFGNLAQNGAGDFDTDGLTNLEESGLGTTPTVADSDSDGISDGDEVHVYGIDPAVSNKGDLGPRGNPDDLIAVGDLVVLARLVSGAITPQTPEPTLADMNDDGEVNAADLLLLQQLILTAPGP